jgi:phenylacetate-CoA ligase
VGTTKTSGTTGLPVTLSVDGYSAAINNALRWRLHRWHRLDWSRPLCLRRGDDPAVGAYPDGKLLGAWGPPFAPESSRGAAWEINRFASIEENGRFLGLRKAAYYLTGPNIAYSLAVTAQVVGLEVKLEAILAQGQRVTDADRAICRKVLGARIIEHYSSKEAGQIAYECPEGRLHVNAEQVHVEIVDELGTPCAPGVSGRLLVTPLYSTAQPLIRYDQGDIAAFAEPCPCGRHGPILAPIQGRMTAIFRHPDGRVIASLMPDSYRDLLGADVWQIAQVGPNAYEVRYVPQSWDDPGDDSEFIARFRAFYFSDADVLTRRVQGFEPTPAGKHPEYVNEYWAPPST